MNENVVYLPALGCSGFLIRNQSDVAVGVLTAQHCSMLASEGRQSTGSAGEVQLDFGQPVLAQTGNSINGLTTVGEINQFLLNSNNDNTRDEALGAFAGHSIDEVVASYSQMQASNADMLTMGSVIYDSGWPVNQPNNPGSMERQDFAMSVLGPTNWNVSSGEKLDLLLAAAPLTHDGSECSWGASGSGGFVVSPEGKPLLVGPLSAFNDFGTLYNSGNPTAAAEEMSYIQSSFWADMSGYAAVCGFSVEPPSMDAGAFVAQVITTSYK